MAPKMTQALLAFAPRLVLPERRADGAAVNITQPAVPATDPVPVPEPAGKKVRRELTFQAKHEVVVFLKSHTVNETLSKFPEVSRSTLFRLKKKAPVFAQAIHAQRAHVKLVKPLHKYRALTSF